MPSVSPLATVMSTCCTAFTMPRRVVNSTVRSLTSSSGWPVMNTLSAGEFGYVGLFLGEGDQGAAHVSQRHAKIPKTTPCKVATRSSHVRRAALFHSLPPYGGGAGRGVAPAAGVRGYPPPPPFPASGEGAHRRMLSQPSRSPLRIDDIAQAVAEQVEAEHGHHQRKAREQRDPPFARDHEAGALGDHDAPLR